MTYCDHQRSCEDICNHRCLYLCAFVCARDITACISLYKPPAKVVENSEFSIKKYWQTWRKLILGPRKTQLNFLDWSGPASEINWSLFQHCEVDIAFLDIPKCSALAEICDLWVPQSCWISGFRIWTLGKLTSRTKPPVCKNTKIE